MSMQLTNRSERSAPTLSVRVFAHPQGCRTYLVTDPTSREALAVDVHLDLVRDVAAEIRRQGWNLRFVVDTHTHADHPSGSAALADEFGAVRVAHAAARHVGVTLTPADGEILPLGERGLTVRFAPGHTPDHLVLLGDRALFSGDSLFIGGVARTDFLGGDAGTLHDSLKRILADLDDDVLLYPGHDYQGRESSTLGRERTDNPWLAMERAAFITHLSADPPPRPANMDDLLRLNASGVDIPQTVPVARAVQHVAAGGSGTIIDVRTAGEFETEHIAGSRLIPVDRLSGRLDEVRATPAPRLLLCRSGVRAKTAYEELSRHGIGGLTVVEGGIEAFRAAGGPTVRGRRRISLERQVRIAGGVLVLLGLALAAVVHPAFLFLVALVGAGQILAGLSDSCLMGGILARAPWNQGSAPAEGRAAGGCAANIPSACAAKAPPACAAKPPQP